MFIKEQVDAKNIKVEDYSLKDFWIEVKIDEKKYRFDLCKTNIEGIMKLYLDYYQNEKLFDVSNNKIMNTIFG